MPTQNKTPGQAVSDTQNQPEAIAESERVGDTCGRLLEHYNASRHQPASEPAQPVPLEQLAEKVMRSLEIGSGNITKADVSGCILRALQQATAQKDAEIAGLKKMLVAHAFDLPPTMVQARNDLFEKEIESIRKERDAALQRCGELENKLAEWFGHSWENRSAIRAALKRVGIPFVGFVDDGDSLGGRVHQLVSIFEAERAAHEATKQQLAASELRCEAMRAALDGMLANDGSRRIFDAQELTKARKKAEQALATPASVLVAQVREALERSKCAMTNLRYDIPRIGMEDAFLAVTKALQLIGEKA